MTVGELIKELRGLPAANQVVASDRDGADSKNMHDYGSVVGTLESRLYDDLSDEHYNCVVLALE